MTNVATERDKYLAVLINGYSASISVEKPEAATAAEEQWRKKTEKDASEIEEEEEADGHWITEVEIHQFPQSCGCYLEFWELHGWLRKLNY